MESAPNIHVSEIDQLGCVYRQTIRLLLCSSITFQRLCCPELCPLISWTKNTSDFLSVLASYIYRANWAFSQFMSDENGNAASVFPLYQNIGFSTEITCIWLFSSIFWPSVSLFSFVLFLSRLYTCYLRKGQSDRSLLRHY